MKTSFPLANLSSIAKAEPLPATAEKSTLHRLNFRFLNISSVTREQISAERIFSIMFGERNISETKKSLM